MGETDDSPPAPYRWSADRGYLTLRGLDHPATIHLFGSRRLFSAADLPGVRSVVRVRQVHGSGVVQIDHRILSEMPEGDALMTDRYDILVTVETADCTPILLFDSSRPAVAAIHAGWRGTVANIAASTVAAMAAAYGSNPATIHAGIGPTIGSCCYEVGREVWERVAAKYPDDPAVILHPDPETESLTVANERARLDLVRLNRNQLVRAGLPPAQIVASDLCTSCHPDHFYSYRRDGVRVGRHISGILLKQP